MTRKPLLFAALALAALLLVASAPINLQGLPISDVSNATGHNGEIQPAAAFNSGFMQDYLVVWEQYSADTTSMTIWGRFVAGNGKVDLGHFNISPLTGFNYNADIVYNPDQDEYLVVYERNAGGIYGQRLTNAGSNIGGEITIAIGLSGNLYFPPAVEYSPVSHRYMVTWTHSFGSGQGIEARSLDTTVAPVTLSVVYPLTGSLFTSPANPAIAWTRPLDSFLVVWQQSVPGSASDIFGRRLTVAGGLSGPVFSVSTGPNDDRYPAIGALNKTTGIGQYLVAFQAFYSGAGLDYIDGQMVTDAGALNGSRLGVSPYNGLQPTVAGNDAAQQYLAAWTRDSNFLEAATFTPDGIRSDPFVYSAADPYTPEITPGRSGDFFIVLQDQVLPGYPYDVVGYLWGNRVYLPLVRR